MSPSTARAKAFLQVVRLPNLFTAAADSLAGWLLVNGSFQSPEVWVPLVASSLCLYAGGVTLNDVFDINIDRFERPNRPLPSGRVSFIVALAIGVIALVLGLGFAALSGSTAAILVALGIIACVLVYDAGLKRGISGPFFMGGCRGLNLLLGMSGTALIAGSPCWQVVLSYAGFVAGITWISRSEVHHGLWKKIALGIALQNLSFFGYLLTCKKADDFPAPTIGGTWPFLSMIYFLGLAIFVNRQNFKALHDARPAIIQRAVKTGIFSLVWLHVGLLLAVRGPAEALVVGLLWIPAVFTGRWIYST